MNYVAGFLFNDRRSTVVLIEKKKPRWQEGLKNGVGGKIESGETPLDAMRREFWEETGLQVDDWQQFAVLQSDPASSAHQFTVHFFRAFAVPSVQQSVTTTTDETVLLVTVEDVILNAGCVIIPNLRWLVPMALSMDEDSTDVFVITETRLAA